MPASVTGAPDRLGPNDRTERREGRRRDHDRATASRAGYRSCQALIRDSKRFGAERTEAACARALQIGNPTRKTVVSILRRGLDQQQLEDLDPELPFVVHENVRGGGLLQPL